MAFIIDAHAHIYPDKIALRAAESIGEFYNIAMSYDGTVDRLLELGDQYGISMFLVQSVATAPQKVAHINDFIAQSVAQHADRFIGFATLHPGMEDIPAEVARIKALGLRGVKLHPDFQKFHINDRAAYPIYEAIEGELPLLIHTGDSRYPFSDPKRVPQVLRDFPKLQMICAHFGGWSQWNEAERVLAGQNVWIDTSSSLYALSPAKARELIAAFGEDRVLFGSDYPMWNPGAEVENILRLGLSERTMQKIFYKNLSELLHLGL